MRRWLVVTVLAAACATTPAKKIPGDAGGNGARPEAVNGAAQVESEATFEVTSEDVQFDSDVSLRGQLVRPVTDNSVPGAVIVHDWGVLGRDGIVGESFGVRLPAEVPIYLALAEALAARGIAVLIYDKRTCVEGREPWCDYPPSYVEGAGGLASAQLADVEAAIAWLSERDGVSSVSVIGHGHGSELATVAASRAGVARVARVALVQPTTSELGELARFQLEESIRQIDRRIAEVGDTPEADLLKEQRDELKQRLGSDDVLEIGADEESALARIHTLHDGAIANADERFLVIEGTIDPGEPPEESERRAAQFGARLVTIENLSRLMVSLGGASDPTVVSEELVSHLSAFLAAPKRP